MLRRFLLTGVLAAAALLLAAPAMADMAYSVNADTPYHLAISVTDFPVCVPNDPPPGCQMYSLDFGKWPMDDVPLTNWHWEIMTDGAIARIQWNTHEVAPDAGEATQFMGPFWMPPIPALGNTWTDTLVVNHVMNDWFTPGPHNDVWTATVTRTGENTLDVTVDAMHGDGEVPEPATLGLLGASLVALGVVRRRRAS